jgi:hypothetical protein
MNKVITNGFTKAMNKDSSKSMIPNTSYLDAKNFRIITTTGATTGSLETIKGNKLISTNAIAAGQFIIGSSEIRDTIVLFTTSNVTTTPENESGKSMIYKFTIDLETEVGTTPVVIYDDSLSTDGSKLNFSTAYPIKAISRYETPNIQKVYFTDGYNSLRYIDIGKNLTLTGEVYPISSYMATYMFEFLPEFIPTTPKLKDIVGGHLMSGMVQYSYQLYKVNGAETAFSPASAMIHIVTANDFGLSTLVYKGDAESIETGKGVKLSIDNQNEGYNRLRLVRIHYATLNAIPTITVCNEIEINSYPDTISVIDVGDTITSLTLDEFNISSTELFVCEDITTKDNRLFAANIKKLDFRSNQSIEDFETRAVRFHADATPYAYLLDSTEDPVSITKPITDNLAGWNTSGWSTYLPTHDGINTFNNTNNDGDANHLFRYQSNGSTLGAEGPNIKIGFNTAPVMLDESGNDSLFFTSPPTDSIDLSYKDFASPWKGDKLSWQRDEVYRLFIQFGNNRGQVADPKWICDLRMPSLHDSGYEVLADPNTIIGAVLTYRLFPTISFKNFPTDAAWARIHRVKRDREDRSVVTQGLVIPTRDGGGGGYYPATVSTNNLSTDGVELIKLVSPEINITKNISYRGNDYVEYVTKFDVWHTNNYNQASMIKNIHKLTGNTLISSGVLKSTISGAVSVSPASSLDASEITILNGRRYINYNSNGTWTKGSTGLLINYDDIAFGIEGEHYCIVNYKSNIFNSQYGGNTFESRTLNTTIPCSDIIYSTDIIDSILSPTIIEIPYGDTFINYFDVSTLLYDLSAAQFDDSMSETVYVPLESSINVSLRHDTSSTHVTAGINLAALRQEYAGTHTMIQGPITILYEQELDLYLYNTVYSQQSSAQNGISTMFDTPNEDTFDCMIKASNIKTNGEYSDSWTKFGLNEFIEVDSLYGPVNAIHTFDNKVYYWQDKAVGIVSVNTRSLIQDNNSSQLVLGTGGVLDRYDYISNYVGCKDKFSIVSSSLGVYWFDRLSKSLYKHANQLANLTKTKSIQSYMTSSLDDEHKSIAHSDIHNDEVLFTFYKNGETDGFTLSFSELIDAFVAFYSFIPTIYIPYKHRYMTTTSSDYSEDVNLEYIFLHDSNIWDRCYFYGLTNGNIANYVDSTLEILFNPEYESTKVFDNIFFLSNAYSSTITTPTLRASAIDTFENTFDSIQCYNDYQNTGEVILTPKVNLERRERSWTTFVPRNIVSSNISNNPNIFTDIYANPATTLYKERMKDKYLIVYFTYHNNGTTRRFVVENVGLKYRTSIR